jgi:hypothetical protein
VSHDPLVLAAFALFSEKRLLQAVGCILVVAGAITLIEAL